MDRTFISDLDSRTRDLRTQGLFKQERILVSPQNAAIRVGGGKEVLNFCANNYLGLADHPKVVAAAQKATEDHGFGMASVRFICGTQDVHKALEARLSRFLESEDTILYGSCFDANGGLFETLLDEKDAVITDALNHASIIDGIRLCKAQRLRYANNDMADLESKLKEASGGYTSGRKEIVAWLRQRSRPYLFSNSLMPAICAATVAVLDLLEEGDGLRKRLRENAEYFRTRMSALGFKLAGAHHPIIPVMLGDAKLASSFADQMLAEGVYVIGFSFPVVPQGQARIRTQMSAAHTREQLDRAIAAFAKVGRSLGVIQ